MKKMFRFICVLTFIALLASCGGSGGESPLSNDTSNPSGAGIPPMVASFTPTAGAVGSTVLLSGAMFGSTPAANTVRFNGVVATVVSASSSQLVVQVPAGATTGLIQVVTSAGSSTSSNAFTVLPNTTTPGVAWTTRLVGPYGHVSGLAWNGTRFVTVGDSINASSDIVHWDHLNTYTNAMKVAWDGHKFVIVGDNGHIYTSPDGLTWTMTVASLGQDLYSVAGSGTTWVAVGKSGTVRVSADAVNWTTCTVPTSKNLRSVAWSGTKFVAVGDDGTIITSPDGITWTDRTAASGTTDSFTAVGATQSLIVAVTFPYAGSNLPTIYTSPDGTTWTPRAGSVIGVNTIVYAGGKWLAAGNSRVATSTDGITWAVNQNGPGNTIGDFVSIVYTGTKYVAAGSIAYTQGAVYTSPDGTTWTLVASQQSYKEVTRSTTDGRLVAVASSGASIASLDNGVTWKFGGLNSGFGGIKWSSLLGCFVAVVSEGANQGIYTSNDGLAWARLANAPLYGKLAASPSLLVNHGFNYTGNGISTSTDGITWTPSTGYTTGHLLDMIWTGSQFIGVGYGGTIATSPTGSTWTKQVSTVTNDLYGIGASPSMLVAVGAGGKILTSVDNGITWVARTSGTTLVLNRVAWTGAEFVAVGNDGIAIRSTDGVNWTISATPYSNELFGSDPYDLNDVIWTGSNLVVVGTRGLVTTSP